MSKSPDGRLEDWLKPGDGVLDIGANVGELTLRYADSVGPTGCVLAVEPVLDQADAVRHIARERPWVHVVDAAVGATVGETVVYPDGARSSRWAALTRGVTAGVTVPMTTLDALALLVPNLAAIKIDTQGGEWDVLAGGSHTLARLGLVWQVEIWPTGLRAAGHEPAEVLDLLERAGLHCLSRNWAQVEAATDVVRGESYFDVVCRHAA